MNSFLVHVGLIKVSIVLFNFLWAQLTYEWFDILAERR